MGRPRLRALVLAAGRGERLRPLTDELPKPLLPVAGRPVAERALAALAALGGAGCDAAALNLHHLGGAIRNAFGDLHRGLPLVYSEEPELLGTGGALPPLAAFLGAAERIVLINGDSLCRWPLERLLAAHRRGRAAVTLLVHGGADPREFGGGVAVERGAVVAFRRGDLAWETAATKRVFAGAAVLEAELVARLPAGRSDIVSALYEPLLAAGERIAAVATARPWHDLGTPRRYLEGALEAARTGLPAAGSWVARDATVERGARLRAAVVEAGARIAGGARLDRCLVLAGASVSAGCELTRVVVGPGVDLAPGTRSAATLWTRDPAGGAPRATPWEE
jgi:mannose-1-phosphate guanylyltransferase